MGQEMITFSAPQRPDPKISQRALNLELFPEKRPQPVLPRVNATLMLGCSLWGRKRSIFLPHKDPTLRYHRSPKIEPKHWYLRCFCNNQKSKCSQNTAICDTLATQHVRNSVLLFYNVFGPPLQKHWYLQCFYKTHA